MYIIASEIILSPIVVQVKIKDFIEFSTSIVASRTVIVGLGHVCPLKTKGRNHKISLFQKSGFLVELVTCLRGQLAFLTSKSESYNYLKTYLLLTEDSRPYTKALN